MTVTPTRLPGLRAALARRVAALLDACARGTSAASMVAMLSTCAAGLIVALGAATSSI